MGIPTRNRAELAMAAVESVLRSDRPDVRLVVSDNSDDRAEQGRLEAFCMRQPPGALDYVRPPEPLPMDAHWEWLRRTIRDRVDPSHVAYLTDRMVYVSGALAELAEVVARHPGQVVSYRHDRVDDLSHPVQLVQSQWTGDVLELDARTLVEMSSRGVYGDYLPRMLNCFVPAGVLTEIERRFGGVFAPASPDYRFAYRCLAVCDSIVHLDRACLVHYGMTRSLGISYLRGRPNDAATGFQDSLAEPLFANTPEPAFETVPNAIFQEYCAVRAETGGDRFPPLVPGPYLRANAIAVARIEDPAWRARLQEVLRRHGWSRRREARYALRDASAMALYFARHPTALMRSVKRQLWDRPPGTPAASLLPKVGLNPRLRDELKFASAGDAIDHNDAHPRPRTSYAWPTEPLRRAGAIVRRSSLR